MAKTDVQKIVKDLAEINGFVRERLGPEGKELGLLKEETEKLRNAVSDLQSRDRANRREAIARQADGGGAPVVDGGPYAGMDLLDLGLLRRFAHSQRRELFGPAWIERVEEARRRMVDAITPVEIQATHARSAGRLNDRYSVGGRPTGQYDTVAPNAER